MSQYPRKSLNDPRGWSEVDPEFARALKTPIGVDPLKSF